MKRNHWVRAWMLCVFIAPSVVSAGLDSAPVVFKSGEWSVHRSTDSMTDKASCVGIYKEDYSIQLNDNSLYIKVRGGVRSITLRFGNQPAEGLRIPSSMEEQVGVIMIQNNDFTKLLASNRLRAQALTVLDSVNNYDIDLAGITAAVENIRSGCPSKALGQNLPKKPSLCGEKVIQRLHSKKVSNEIIEYACSSH